MKLRDEINILFMFGYKQELKKFIVVSVLLLLY